jgi:FKBP-type peptidyl-prolyl cis-trans isomerase FkpA
VRAIKLSLLCSLILLSSCLNTDEGPTAQEQFDNELIAIDEHLANLGITPIIDASGLRIVIDELGTGLPPKQTSKVKVNYVGKLLDGSVFDQGTLDQTFTSTITGWKLAMSLMPEGTKATFYMPSAYGYGSQALSNIPANSTLVFLLDLEEVYITEEEQNQLKSDTVLIDNFIAAKNIENVQKDSTGLRYVVKEQGSGPFATWFSQVKVQYTGSILSNGELTEFGNGLVEPTTLYNSRVIHYIDGWKVGLQKLQKEVAQSKIPANSILVFDVELLDLKE